MNSNLAAERMDRMYRYQRYIYNITRRYYLLGRDPLIRSLSPKPGDTVVEVACGTARNLLCAADRYQWASYYGIDISREMLRTAHESIEYSGHAGRIRLAVGDAETLDLRSAFNLVSANRIFFSYAVSMIPNWPQALDRALSHLAPGGELHIVDFGTMKRLPAPFRAMLKGWLNKFGVTPRPDLETVCQELAAFRQMSCKVQESRTGYWVKAVICRPMT